MSTLVIDGIFHTKRVACHWPFDCVTAANTTAPEPSFGVLFLVINILRGQCLRRRNRVRGFMVRDLNRDSGQASAVMKFPGVSPNVDARGELTG